jgi:hypothetical protein
MIQFSIQKGQLKKGNAIRLNQSSSIFSQLPGLLTFIKTQPNSILEERLQRALEVFLFKDGTIYVLNSIGRSRKIQMKDIKNVLNGYVNSIEEKRTWIREVIQKHPVKTREFMEILQNEVFGEYLREVPEEKREYEWILDLDKESLTLFKKETKCFSVSIEDICSRNSEELTYEIYKNYLSFPLMIKK